MPISHILLAALVAIVWGLNFIFIKFGLGEMPPLLLCAARFILASLPAVFFIKPPKIPFKITILYGLVMFALQFALLFGGMYAGMTPGMASLIMQLQVFFSIFFAAIYLEEKPSSWQISGALISFLGIGLVAKHFDSNISLLGFLLILAAAATWGVGNLITKKIKTVNMFALVIWGNLIASLPMLMLSLIFEGPDRLLTSYHHLNGIGVASVCYIAYISTWVGYGVWTWLISRYPVGMVVPFTLLVPIVGIASSMLVLHEPFAWWKLAAGVLVISGLCINLLGARFFTRPVSEC